MASTEAERHTPTGRQQIASEVRQAGNSRPVSPTARPETAGNRLILAGDNKGTSEGGRQVTDRPI